MSVARPIKAQRDAKKIHKVFEDFWLLRRGKIFEGFSLLRRGTMADGNVFACHSTEAWRSKLQEAIDTKRLVVVDFTATWCGPCRVISPVFVELSRRFPEIFFLKVDVDELRDVAQEWDVEAMPTFIFIKEGKAVDKVVGAKKDELERKVTALATDAALTAQA